MPLDLSWLVEAQRRLAAQTGGGNVFERLMQMDTILAAKGFPPMSPWWKETLRAFYTASKRQLILRVGRRGGKSSTLCRVAVAEALFGQHKIPPGTLGVFAIVSINKEEASDRLYTIKAILDALGIFYRPVDHGIALNLMPIAFRVYAATIGGVSGFTGIGVLLDEVAKWRDNDTGVNPATEVARSIRPSILTMKTAKFIMSSSPWSTLDAHYEAFERGHTEGQMVAHAPTWEANPTQTEAGTRLEEPDEATWMREYAAVPMAAGTSSFFDAKAIDAAIDPDLIFPAIPEIGELVSAGGDFGFRGDSSALAVVAQKDGAYRLAELLELRPSADAPLVPSRVVGEFADCLKRNGADYLMADSHYRQAITEHIEAAGLQFIPAPEGQKGIQETYIRARVLLHGGQLRIPKHDRLIRQLKEVISRPTPGGAVSISQPRKAGGGHGDLVSALVLAIYQRAGVAIDKPTGPKFGTLEYWGYVRSGEYADKQEAAWLEKETEKIEREKRGGDLQWWDRESPEVPWWDRN